MYVFLHTCRFFRCYTFVVLVFTDDSGDPGFKVEQGSSKIFLIACVIFYDELEAEKTAVAIKELRRSLKFPDDVEFKFNKSSKKVKESILRSINRFNFKIRTLGWKYTQVI